MRKLLILTLTIFSIVSYYSISHGSGTYRLSRKIKPYANSSSLLRANFKEVKSFFGVSKSFRHIRDSKTIISYKFIENPSDLNANLISPKKLY